MKNCTKCGSFNERKHAWCNSCRRERWRETYKRRIEFYREKGRKRYQIDKLKDYPRLMMYRTRSKLKRKYGMTLDDRRKMIEAQKGQCAICQFEVALLVDHNHKTGTIRELLCRRCNTWLAVLENKPFVERATAYLRKHEITVKLKVV